MTGCTTLPASPNLLPELHNTPFIVTGAVYSGDPEEGMRIVQPRDLRCLEEIKATYDPDNFLRLNNNIPLATYAGRAGG